MDVSLHPIRTRFVVAMCVVSASLLLAPRALIAQNDDANAKALIERMLRDQYDALLALDATRYASHLADSAVWENALGDRYVGRDSIRAFNERVAATMRGARYDDWEVQIRFVTRDVAIADVSTTLRGQNIAGRRLADRPMLNVYVLRREADRWRIAHTRIRDQWVLRYADQDGGVP